VRVEVGAMNIYHVSYSIELYGVKVEDTLVVPSDISFVDAIKQAMDIIEKTYPAYKGFTVVSVSWTEGDDSHLVLPASRGL